MNFQIKEDFLLDGQPIKLISGAIHYFRIPVSRWYQSLYNLKAMGGNTVETYIPWNFHEQEEGQFNFEGMADIEKFVEMAQELDLLVILRPSPYICAEWEFGGYPAWLLNKNCRVRSRDEEFIQAVDKYFAVMLPKLAKYQFTRGGKVIMMQIENEYGSYSNDKEYLRINKQLMEKYGIDVPLFTSDGGADFFLRAGGLAEDDILPTANFGSGGPQAFAALEKYNEEHGKKWPYMCMEFWDGWFNNWGVNRIVRDPEETAEEVRKVLELGSINLYMFHGGTNFGFWNGANWAIGEEYKPQVTSYDYDAPLDEQGNPTEKYFAIRRVIGEMFPELDLPEPMVTKGENTLTAKVVDKVSLFETLDTLSTPFARDYTMSMEQLEQWYGYVLYETKSNFTEEHTKYRIVNGNDRVQVFQGSDHKITQMNEEIGEEFTLAPSLEPLRILAENRGRVNYGPYMVDPTQYKGIKSGVKEGYLYLSDWQHYSLPLDKIELVDFSKKWIAGTPSFYRFQLSLTEEQMQDYFIELGQKGKGVVYVNGFNAGRYWEIGPFTTTYVPIDFWKVGENEIVIFETEGKEIEEITLGFEHRVISVE